MRLKTSALPSASADNALDGLVWPTASGREPTAQATSKITKYVCHGFSSRSRAVSRDVQGEEGLKSTRSSRWRPRRDRTSHRRTNSVTKKRGESEFQNPPHRLPLLPWTLRASRRLIRRCATSACRRVNTSFDARSDGTVNRRSDDCRSQNESRMPQYFRLVG